MKKSEIKWKSYIEALRRFSADNGHTAVPAGYETNDEGSVLKLGHWVGYIRARGRSGKIGEQRRAELESIPNWTWNARRPGPTGNPERDSMIFVARQNGRSLQSIAVEWNLSRQRVHQIIQREEVRS